MPPATRSTSATGRRSPSVVSSRSFLRLRDTAAPTCGSMPRSRLPFQSAWSTLRRRGACSVSSLASRSRAGSPTWCAGTRQNACLDGALRRRSSDRAPDDLRICFVQQAAELDPMLLDDLDPAVPLQPMQSAGEPFQEIADVMASHRQMIDEIGTVVPFINGLDEHAPLRTLGQQEIDERSEAIRNLLQRGKGHDHTVGRNLDVVVGLVEVEQTA